MIGREEEGKDDRGIDELAIGKWASWSKRTGESQKEKKKKNGSKPSEHSNHEAKQKSPKKLAIQGT